MNKRLSDAKWYRYKTGLVGAGTFTNIRTTRLIFEPPGAVEGDGQHAPMSAALGIG